MSEGALDSGIDQNESLEGVRVFYFRHSMAKYRYYADKVGSADPHGTLDIEAQHESDLTDDPNRDGFKFAREQAQRFFSTLKAEKGKDTFYIVSSDQRRTLDTAAIYAEIADELGFTVVTHENTGTDIAQKVGAGKVRSLETLSVNHGDAVTDAVFNPPEQLPKINWDAIDPEFKERWEKAREIVLKYNDEVKARGGRPAWGDSAFHCAEEIKMLLPEVRTPKELQQDFAKMLRLVRFAQTRKTAEGSRINVLAFGHENAPGPALQEHTGSHVLTNCESFEVKDGKPVRVSLDAIPVV